MSLATETRPPQSSVKQLTETLRKQMDMCNVHIETHLQSDIPLIPALADHLISAGGKRVRPLLTLASAALFTDNHDHMDNAARLAAAVEFIHTATLLHDDIVDTSELRRGRMAAHLIWSTPSAVLVGDFLFARAFELMVATGHMKALQTLSTAARVIAEGEVAQLTALRDITLGQQTYFDIITAKTAKLFSAAAESGAIAAEATPEHQAALAEYGLQLGIAFQLADDALDYDGDAEALGKNVGDDLREGKLTLPLLLAIERTPENANLWAKVFDTPDDLHANLPNIMHIVADTGAIDDTWAMAHTHADKAATALHDLRGSDHYDMMVGMAYECAKRRT